MLENNNVINSINTLPTVSSAASIIAGFPDDDINDLKGMLADQQEIIRSLSARNDLLEAENYLSRIAKLSHPERRAIIVIKKIQEMDEKNLRRFAKRITPKGRIYLESTEITDLLKSEDVPEDIRYKKGMGTNRLTLDLMKLIVERYPDDFGMEPEKTKKKVMVLYLKD